MTLQEYIYVKRGNATRLAAFLEITLTYLSQMASGKRAISTERAVLIESFTKKVVSREEMFPDSWQDKWPELAKRNKPTTAGA